MVWLKAAFRCWLNLDLIICIKRGVKCVKQYHSFLHNLFLFTAFHGISQNLDTKKYILTSVITKQHLVVKKKPNNNQLSIIAMQGFVSVCVSWVWTWSCTFVKLVSVCAWVTQAGLELDPADTLSLCWQASSAPAAGGSLLSCGWEGQRQSAAEGTWCWGWWCWQSSSWPYSIKLGCPRWWAVFQNPCAHLLFPLLISSPPHFPSSRAWRF